MNAAFNQFFSGPHSLTFLVSLFLNLPFVLRFYLALASYPWFGCVNLWVSIIFEAGIGNWIAYTLSSDYVTGWEGNTIIHLLSKYRVCENLMQAG
jgi:hypothetical protein